MFTYTAAARALSWHPVICDMAGVLAMALCRSHVRSVRARTAAPLTGGRVAGGLASLSSRKTPCDTVKSGPRKWRRTHRPARKRSCDTAGIADPRSSQSARATVTTRATSGSQGVRIAKPFSALSSCMKSPARSRTISTTRLARGTSGSSPQEAFDLHELVGPASESWSEHRRRHTKLLPECSRCVFQLLRPICERTYGSHRHENAGREVHTVWLAQRPANLGGMWGLGCIFCAQHAQKLTAARTNRQRPRSRPVPQRTRRGEEGTAGAWSRFAIRSLSQMALKGARQHAETISHRLSTRAYFRGESPQVFVSSVVGLFQSDMQLFRGGVPQVADWLRSWRACRTPIAFTAAAQIGFTNNFIHSTRQPVAVERKAFRSMVRIMAFALRARKRNALAAATSICLSLDDRGAYRLIRYKCDAARPADADPLSWMGSVCGILGVLRRGGKPKTIDDLTEDYSRQMAESVLTAIRRICTDIDGSVKEALEKEIHGKVRMGVADGGSSVQKCLQFLAAGAMPQMMVIVRDLAHKARSSTKDPLVSDPTFKAWYDAVFDQRHALVPDIMNSDAWLEKLLIAQRVVLGCQGVQGGGMTAAAHVLRFAKQRFDSCASPQRQFCCMFVAIGMVLAFQASDPRLDPETRKRAALRVEEMPGYLLPQGLSATYSEEVLEFVRLFDVADHDPALTWGPAM